jgi:hypothetical protein
MKPFRFYRKGFCVFKVCYALSAEKRVLGKADTVVIGYAIQNHVCVRYEVGCAAATRSRAGGKTRMLYSHFMQQSA